MSVVLLDGGRKRPQTVKTKRLSKSTKRKAWGNQKKKNNNE